MPKNANFDKKYRVIMKIAISGRVSDARNSARIRCLIGLLHGRGAELCCDAALCDALAAYSPDPLPAGRFSHASDLPADVSLFLTLGGDGTFLSALEMVYGRDIRVAGINFGRLGFLTSAGMSDDCPKWLDDLLSGNYSIQERSVLKVCSPSLTDDFYPLALNEFVFRRSGSAMLSVNVFVDGRPLPAYWADGILVATPTGSTAYSLSLGGPVVMPDSEVMLITPLASHNLNVRPLVIPLSSRVDIAFGTSDKAGMLIADNRAIEVPAGEAFTVTRAEHAVKCISFNDDNFITALKAKLFWGEDRRNETI